MLPEKLNNSWRFIMREGKIKRAFLGGNTEQGFYSYYDNILPKDKATKIFIIKGGPGVGKSTFMKEIGKVLHNKGYDLEYMHCSSDINSIDGLVVPKINIALLDGTSPHVVDPKYPGVVDETIDLGMFWNIDGIEKKRELIINESVKKTQLFTRAYRYLKASGLIHQDIVQLNSMSIDLVKVNTIAIEMVNEVFKDDNKSPAEGRERKLFASAITPEGLVNYLDTILITERVYGIKEEAGLGSERILMKVRDAALDRGFYTECFFCALSPRKLEHLVIPEKNISITTINKYHETKVIIDKLIDLDKYRDNDTVEKNKSTLEYNILLFEELLHQAIKTIKEAKISHSLLESYYAANMNFNQLQRYRDEITARILRYAYTNSEINVE